MWNNVPTLAYANGGNRKEGLYNVASHRVIDLVLVILKVFLWILMETTD